MALCYQAITFRKMEYTIELLLVFPGYMMTSSNGNIFRVTGPLRGEFTGHKG